LDYTQLPCFGSAQFKSLYMYSRLLATVSKFTHHIMRSSSFHQYGTFK
jgi:hypothetical protein